MNYPVAIMDYGIGGLGLVSMIKHHYPDFPILYFSDSGEVPYGKLTFPVLKARVEKVVNYLMDYEAAHVVVACHSASSVITPNEHLTGIRESTIQSIEGLKLKSIGIIGGGRTIRSMHYRNRLSRLGFTVKQRIAQQLSILIESGQTDTTEVVKAVRDILKPIQDVDALLLACTHYSAIQSIISEAMKDECMIVEPANELFSSIEGLLKDRLIDQGDDIYLTSGDPELMKVAAKQAFGFVIPEAKEVLI